MNPYPARVAGIFNEYAGREMILSPAYYAAVFGASPENNAFLVHWRGADPAALREQLGGIEGFEAMSEAAVLRATYQSFAGVLNLIAGVLTLVAALMAYFILLNLASMYVNQKKRELTIMRVNGFTVKEVIRYVAGDPSRQRPSALRSAFCSARCCQAAFSRFWKTRACSFSTPSNGAAGSSARSSRLCSP